MIKKFLLLGSCRVVNTIAYELGDNILLNRKDLWFTHYPQEHIQKIKHLFGLSLIPSEHKELFVRFEQQHHYSHNSELKVGDSIDSGVVELQTNGHYGTLNVVVELPSIHYIKVPIEDKTLWGHITNVDLIRNSPFNQVGGYSTDEQFLGLLTELEQVILESVSFTKVAESVKFIYVPHNPFIELEDSGWGISERRAHIFDLICKHCSKNTFPTKFTATRCLLDIKTMIEENGGIEYMFEDQNHYSSQGRKVAFKYMYELAQ